jgi:hypothetical protein
MAAAALRAAPARRDAEIAQAMEYARRLNDIAVNCEIAAFEGDASDLRRIAEWLATPPSRSDAGSVEARSHWAIEASIPEDGFECYYLLRDDITVAEICGHQTEQRGRHLDDLVFAANGNTPDMVTAWPIVEKWLKAYAEEEELFSKYRDDVILDGIMSAGQRRALSAALVPPPSEAGRLRKALEIARPYVERAYWKTSGDECSAEILKKELAQIDAALSPDPGTVAVASAVKPAIDPNDPNNESRN